ncbi:MAG: sigma-54-dependent Fis family transcriptional regulator [Acidobacteriota bacterium]|nr:MAG: sigma-54-dependent Fis family transcriptional regulator [Acidobacteriota bacterium]
MDSACSAALSSPEVASLLESFSDAAVILGRDHRILAANGSYCDRFAKTSPIIGQPCHRVSHRYSVPCPAAGEDCPIARCESTGQKCRVVHVHHTSRGRRHEEITAHPIRDTTGEIIAFMKTIHCSGVSHAEPAPDRLVGRSPSFLRMLELAGRVAPSEAAVLLLGESGTGKELLAEAIHAQSNRSSGPFVAVDCSGLTETLFESELFGHEKGSYTGAHCRTSGLVDAARGGTLFLDEIGDIQPCQQVKLLRLFESGVFRRVGSVDLIKADFRLVCATHRDIESMVAAGTFRRDLYYRISTFPIHIPPLRERCDDIPILAETLLSRSCRRKPRRKLAAGTIELLLTHHYPGNIRELRNVLQRACLLADGELILPDHITIETSNNGSVLPQAAEEIVPLEEMERRYLMWAEAKFNGNRRDLAKRLGLNIRTFYRKIRTIKDDVA